MTQAKDEKSSDAESCNFRVDDVSDGRKIVVPSLNQQFSDMHEQDIGVIDLVDLCELKLSNNHIRYLIFGCLSIKTSFTWTRIDSSYCPWRTSMSRGGCSRRSPP